MARNNNTRMFLSVMKNIRMDETYLSLRRKFYLSIGERGIYTYIYTTRCRVESSIFFVNKSISIITKYKYVTD